jgi:hypothetical protein
LELHRFQVITMKNVNVKAFLGLILLLSAAAWVALAYFGGLDLSKIGDFFSLIPKVVTVDAVAIAIFTKWLWRWTALKGWLVPFPDLNGTWLGEIHSDWIDSESGNKVSSIPAMVTIRQSFFNISVVMQTAEMRSDSYVEGFQINPDKQIKRLSYSYTSSPRILLQHRSTPNDGTVVFEIIQSSPMKLKGRYWTERKTTGELNFTFHSKEMLEEIPGDFAAHPMSE